MKGGAEPGKFYRLPLARNYTDHASSQCADHCGCCKWWNLMKPYLLDRVVSAGGEEVKKFLPTSGGTLMTATEAANLTELMRDVVVEGTGSSVRTDAYTVAAKTGTAEFETGKETHAWFTGFAPAESPKIVVTVW
mgnify:CR=1 FL=1